MYVWGEFSHCVFIHNNRSEAKAEHSWETLKKKAVSEWVSERLISFENGEEGEGGIHERKRLWQQRTTSLPLRLPSRLRLRSCHFRLSGSILYAPMHRSQCCSCRCTPVPCELMGPVCFGFCWIFYDLSVCCLLFCSSFIDASLFCSWLHAMFSFWLQLNSAAFVTGGKLINCLLLTSR